MKKKIQGTRSNFFHFSTSNQVCMPVFFQLDISFDPQFKQKNIEKATIYYLFSFFGLFGGFSLREGPKIDGLPHILGLLNQKSITLINPFWWVILVLPYWLSYNFNSSNEIKNVSTISLKTLIFFAFLIWIADLKVHLRSAYGRDIHIEYFWRQFVSWKYLLHHNYSTIVEKMGWNTKCWHQLLAVIMQ